MEIHGSSLNFSALRPSSPTLGKLDAANHHSTKHEATRVEDRQKSSETVDETTPASVEQILANARVVPSVTELEKNNLPLDVRKRNAINAYTSQSNQPLAESRSQRLAGIDLYV